MIIVIGLQQDRVSKPLLPLFIWWIRNEAQFTGGASAVPNSIIQLISTGAREKYDFDSEALYQSRTWKYTFLNIYEFSSHGISATFESLLCQSRLPNQIENFDSDVVFLPCFCRTWFKNYVSRAEAQRLNCPILLTIYLWQQITHTSVMWKKEWSRHKRGSC